MPPLGKEEQSVLENRVMYLEKTVEEIRDAVKSIDSSLKVFARLEVEHSETRSAVGRAFTDLEDHEVRLREIEKEMPTMKLTRGWIVTAVIAIVAMVGLFVLKPLGT